ncbi:carbamoyltransferase [Teredinibacter turnerae]|uniref:carbamoyltransferase family protein n=1 Tax=Teredinibacter turnerae TaxID=2426 RepID=UPI00036748EF|nr:carbamoyltransferase C-terminal domain-containing protein [Teredinibacter turnerae]
MNSLILGLGGSNHDFSAALIVDGKVAVAIEEERIDRVKHGSRRWNNVPTEKAIQYCLEALSLPASAITAVYANEDNLFNQREVCGHLVNGIGHHACHAAASFYTAPFNDATILVLDGHGSQLGFSDNRNIFETLSLGHADSSGIKISVTGSGSRIATRLNWHYVVSNSLGSFYKVISELIGFGMYGTGKTMGLSAYGDNSLISDIRQWITLDEEFNIKFDPYAGISDWVAKVFRDSRNPAQTRANIASAAQRLFEELLLAIARNAYDRNPSSNLAYSGGCALNTLANRRLLEETEFKRIHIYPATGDAGLAVGSALMGAASNEKIKIKKTKVSDLGKIAFTGKEYKEPEILHALENSATLYRKISNPTSKIADWIADGEIVGIFRGRSEIGPRALGNRSIFANPKSASTLMRINEKIKNRESFRPLAPIVPFDRVQDYFDLSVDNPFMLFVAKVLPQYQAFLGAITHVDETARVQTVRKEADPFLYQLLLEIDIRTGYPIILNTSFNRRDEPLVETPEDAIACYEELKLDRLYISGYVVERHSPWAFPV